MKKEASFVPKLILLATLISILGIVFIFFRPKAHFKRTEKRPETKEKLFARVVQAAQAQIQKIWEEGDRLIKKEGLHCDEEILFDQSIGRSYYQCQPHFWQCYWGGGVIANPVLKVDLYGETFHLRAKASFSPQSVYSSNSRYYEILKGPYLGLNFHYGMLTEFTVDEIPDMTLPIILTDTCRDTYLPQRIYGYGKIDPKIKNKDFEWDNFDRQIFIDRFYVTNQQVNEWYLLTGNFEKISKNRSKWPLPALLNRADQINYCTFWGKRLMEAKLFDAASMTPLDLKNPLPERVMRPATPWQRDLGKSFLGMARVNPDYQLTPLDCQLAQVQGCKEKHFTTDSVTWMGMNYALGFYPESLLNDIETEKNLKLSSRFFSPASEVHELGTLDNWKGGVQSELHVAFRCYEEVSL